MENASYTRHIGQSFLFKNCVHTYMEDIYVFIYTVLHCLNVTVHSVSFVIKMNEGMNEYGNYRIFRGLNGK